MFGNSTAGGAYVPGLCDHVVMVKGGAKVFLGGPPLVKMATGEDADDEELGGAEMHARVSGLADYLAVDELDCIRIGREIVRRLNWRKLGPGPARPIRPRRSTTPRTCSAWRRPTSGSPSIPRGARRGSLDGSEFDEFKPLYGPSLVTGWGELCGYPVGILANARACCSTRRARRPRSSSSSPTRSTSPLLFLQNTTGYMVGKDYEQRGIIKDGAKMINAVSNSTRADLTVNLGALLRRRQLRHVRLRLRAPLPVRLAQRQVAVMGPQQLAGVLSIVRAAVGRGSGPRVRRGRRRGHADHGRGPDRARDRSPCSSPARSTTTASSIPATPAPCSAWRCRPPTAPRCAAPTGFGVFRM